MGINMNGNNPLKGLGWGGEVNSSPGEGENWVWVMPWGGQGGERCRQELCWVWGIIP